MAYVPQQFGGSGNLATAIGLWDQFLGPTSDRNKQALENAKLQNQATRQSMDLAKTGEVRAAEMHIPNLATANAVADLHKNDLAKSNTDEETRKGSIAALGQTPVSLWKPTSSMSDDELTQWQTLHQQNGVKDFNSAAKAWNSAMANVTGQAQPIKGMMNIQATQDPSGGVSTISTIKNIANPAELNSLGMGTDNVEPPPASAPSTPPPGWRPPMALPVSVTRPQAGAGPAQPAAANPFISNTSPNNAPSASDLARVTPGTRAALSEGAEARGKFLGNTEKEIAMNKAKMEEFYGSPEERKADSEFMRNSIQAMNRLNEYAAVVKAHGNTPGLTMDPNARAALHSLPLLIADNMSKVANPGGMLREGLVHLNKEDLIPAGWGTLSSTTSAAIERVRNVVGDYVKQYENIPWTRNPVEGLSPEDRQRVGPTKFFPASDGSAAPPKAFGAGKTQAGTSPESAILPASKEERDAAVAAGKWITDGKGNFVPPNSVPRFSDKPQTPKSQISGNAGVVPVPLNLQPPGSRAPVSPQTQARAVYDETYRSLRKIGRPEFEARQAAIDEMNKVLQTPPVKLPQVALPLVHQ